MSGNSMQREVEPAVLEKIESRTAAVQSDQTLQNDTIITTDDKPLMSEDGSCTDACTSVSSDNSNRDSSDTQTGSTSNTSVTGDTPRDVKEVESPLERREDEVPAEKKKEVMCNNDVSANDSPATGEKIRKSGKDFKGGITINGKKRYPCPFPGCIKTFSTSGHSSRHSRIHTGEKPYRCSYPGCGAQFSRYDNSLQHYRTHIISSKGGKKFRGKGNASAGKNTEESPLVFKPNPDRGYATEPDVFQLATRKEPDRSGYAPSSDAFPAAAVPAISEPELALSKEYHEVSVGNVPAAVEELHVNSTLQAHAAFDNGLKLPSKGMATDHMRPKKIRSHATEATMSDTPKFGSTDLWPDARMHGVSSEANVPSMSGYSHSRIYSPRDVYNKRALSRETLRSHNIVQNRKRLKSEPGYIYPPFAHTSGSGAYSATGTSDAIRANATGLGSKASTLAYPSPDRNDRLYPSRWQLRIPPTRTRCEVSTASRPASYQMRKSGSLPSLLSLDMPCSERSSYSLSKYSLASESPSVVNPMPVEPANRTGTPMDKSASKLLFLE